MESHRGRRSVSSPELIELPAIVGEDGYTWYIGVQDTSLKTLDWDSIKDSAVWDAILASLAGTDPAVVFTRAADIEELLTLWGLKA